MSSGLCLHCGLRVDIVEPVDMHCGKHFLHTHCVAAWDADRAATVKRPKSAMKQQLDRIEGLLMAIRDRYSL